MDNNNVASEVISLNSSNKMSKDGVKIRCRSPLLLSNSFGKVHSRYLSEPIGSCHNLCKYGRKHGSEHGEKNLTFRRFMANSIDFVKGPTCIDTKKKMLIMMEPSGKDKVVEQNIQPKEVGISDNSVNTNLLTLLSKHRRAVSSPQFMVSEELERRTGSLAKKIGLLNDSMNIVSETRSPAHKRIESFEEIIPRSSEKKIQSQVEDDEKGQINIVESEKIINVDSLALLFESKSKEISPQVILPEFPDNEIIYEKFSNGSNNKKQVNQPKVSSLPKSTPLKSNILKQKNSSASTEAEFGDNTKLEVMKQKNSVIIKKSASFKLQTNNQNDSLLSRKANSTAAPAIPLNVRTPLMRSQSQLNTSKSMNNRMNREEKRANSSEKPEIGEMKLLKPQKTPICSTAPASSTASKKEDKRHAIRTSAAPQLADNSSSPYKLKFQRGKVLEHRTPDTTAPKRLRFNRGRVLGENSNAEATKRTFRRKRDIGGSKEHNSDARAATMKKVNSKAKTSIFKYQDAEVKKEIRGLLNYVIEETASKLVEAKKSKVKALVGAFETVISLQEAKPASLLKFVPFK
ncbi:uncharacterized protein LOC110025843 [Phalaenopsis equestris]|uniref:uncharacterized protein LOC110025843 n=1 Tax=Phalaenopsis equestris TaxID=78828 RepID=UPI0009E3C04C|nr:uncharacterized protein LOC110025843 [Phalaenopsis equestris]